MDFDQIQSLNLLSQKLRHHSKNQSVISENMASADIPGYKKKMLKTPDFNGMVNDKLGQISLKTTNSNHITEHSGGLNNGVYSTQEKVKLDMEAFEMMKNNTSYAEGTITYKKMLSLMKNAVGDNGGG